MGYATLAGAVLCMELMNPNPVTTTISEEGPIAGELYSRSSIIQQLSLLAGYLKPAGLSRTNSPVASNIRAVIKKVLDHVLNNNGVSEPSTALGGSSLPSDWDLFSELDPWTAAHWLMEDHFMQDSSGLP